VANALRSSATQALSAKIHKDTLYALYDASGEGSGGCCADTLRMYPRDGSAMSSVSLDALVATALNSSDAHVSHTFDLTVVDGALCGLFMVKYAESTLGSAYTDALVMIDLTKREIVPDADGESAFKVREPARRSSVPRVHTGRRVLTARLYASGGPPPDA
jgi:hypothetical protein